jgi:hypothetical protein
MASRGSYTVIIELMVPVLILRIRRYLTTTAPVMSTVTMMLTVWWVNAAAETTIAPSEESIFGKEKPSVSCACTIPKEIMRNVCETLKVALDVKQLCAESTGGNSITMLCTGSGRNPQEEIALRYIFGALCVDRYPG